ncbi:hypothetical protein jhhlp_003028 [Lomentospora prolificans]|uniref:Uncharacterized protein n=1 Tax=Lomentospora prolificans TaxID=41688 RepID=A0A2N3NFL4_9PEZI|nr:hypothetical protein jhhlp_003028 [Lomentospora prolificans]
MKYNFALIVASFAGVSHASDYFLRFVGGNTVIDGQLLRLNNSSPNISPGVSEPPYNPADHYTRFSDSTAGELHVVATNPHPPPVTGYLALSEDDTVEGALRLIETWQPTSEGVQTSGWRILRKCDGTALLRFGEGNDNKWIAVQEQTPQGFTRWVPWWVTGDVQGLGDALDVVDVEVVETNCPVNSNAPGGVEDCE